LIDQNNRLVQQITVESLNRVLNERKEEAQGKRSETKTYPSKQPMTGKSSPVKGEKGGNMMDKEGI
jgi:hypothetical protein